MIVMVMCAPGEHHLAVMAGWEEWLAWGMPACLVAYAGIAASVATRRARGSQGRKTAILGAFTSLGAAMAAQPVSHMFVTGHWVSHPAPVWIVWSVSLVPPLVLGHLMHVAASHSTSVPDTAAPQVEFSWDSESLVPAPRPVPQDKQDEFVATVSRTLDVPEPVSRTTEPVPPVSRTAEPVPVSLVKRDKLVRPDKLGQKRDLTELVRSLRDSETDEAKIKKLVRERVPDVNPESLRKAVSRTRTA
jgi:hypothetical protein